MEKYQVLVYENEDTGIQVFREVTEQNQFALKFCKDAEELADAAQKEHPGIVFLDLDMPEFSDREKLYAYLKSLVDAVGFTGIIIIASRVKRQVYDNLRKLGAFNFFRKPFTVQELEQKLDTVISLRSFNDRMVDTAAERVGFSVEHYIEQPLTAVLGAAKMLRVSRQSGQVLEEEQLNEVLDIIIQGSDELSRTVKKFGKLKRYTPSVNFSNKKIIDIDSGVDQDIEEEIQPEGDIQLF